MPVFAKVKVSNFKESVGRVDNWSRPFETTPICLQPWFLVRGSNTLLFTVDFEDEMEIESDGKGKYISIFSHILRAHTVLYQL